MFVGRAREEGWLSVFTGKERVANSVKEKTDD